MTEKAERIITEVEKAVIGKRPLLKRVMFAVLAGGHLLFEDYPGLAKTLIAKSFARALGLEFKRIQFTPDLLPGDVTGAYIFDRKSGEFLLRKGPIFANIILADEINRASPKTQSALLEAMQEYQVTLEGETLPLPQPFIVMATQNPIEFEGTFPLPEAQLDRFLMKLGVGYPSHEKEAEILLRRQERGTDEVELQTVTTPAELMEMRRVAESIHIHRDLVEYIVSIVEASRSDEQIQLGASPRASLALLKLSRASAALDGREYVIPDDIKSVVESVLAHRLILKPDMWARDIPIGSVIERIVRRVPVPKVE
ncbi:MAG: magnesium chelatase [Candidatus Fraserbacteria bacterium RBG_16_55_9]|uniref:Magnesium chelatase n=1 Tax=Fraserbacteria sp. (strain RBG_16_55_9) TaxID=1817864 RepID=A0A1F5UQ55_FRAXR|nr:MAG: magnesium chelatase [Candidatus Fraserbacteria bacterium RBG_16_55_9]